MAVFSRIGYTRTEARSRLFDVMWAHDYPFGGDLKEMLQTLEPHQKVRMHLPFLTIFLIYPPSPPTLLTHPPLGLTLLTPFTLHYNICLECGRNSSILFSFLINIILFVEICYAFVDLSNESLCVKPLYLKKGVIFLTYA